jgi:Leucine-rich repeat (LRR) protein
LILVTCLGIALGIWCERAERQRRIVQLLDEAGVGWQLGPELPGLAVLPEWTEEYRDAHYWRAVESIYLPTKRWDQPEATTADLHEWLALCQQLPILRDLDVGVPVDAGALKQIAAISGLQKLEFSAHTLREADVPHLRKLRRLREVKCSLKNAEQEAESLRFLAELTNTKSLTIQYCDDQGLKYLAPLTRLEYLDILDGDFHGDDFDLLQGLPLRELHLPPGTFGDKGGASLKNFPGLEHVYLPFTLVGDETAGALAKLPGLQTLYVDGTLVSDAGAAALAKSKSLKLLSIDENAIGPKGLVALAQSQSLTRLSVCGTPLSRKDLLNFGWSKVLKELAIGDEVASFAPWKLYKLATEVPSAEERGLIWLTPDEMVQFFQDDLVNRSQQQNVENVQTEPAEEGVGEEDPFAWQDWFIDEWAVFAPYNDDRVKLHASLPGLRSLDLSNSVITDDGLASLAAVESLRSLNCSNTSVSLAGVRHLAALPRLESLDLVGCQNIDSSVIEVLSQMPALQYVGLAGTKVAREDVLRLARLEKFKWLGTDFGFKGKPDMRMSFFLEKPFAQRDSNLYEVESIADLLLPGESHWLFLDVSNDGPTTDEQVANLAKATGLLRLRAELNDEQFAKLHELTALTEIGLVGPHVGKQSIRGALERKQLERLLLYRVRFTSDDWAELRGAKVPAIVLYDVDITDDCLKTLAAMSQLRFVTLKGTSVSDASVSGVIESCPHLTSFNFDAERCSPQVVRQTISRLSNLLSVKLGPDIFLGATQIAMLRGQQAYDSNLVRHGQITESTAHDSKAERRSRGDDVNLSGGWVDDSIGLPDGSVFAVSNVDLSHSRITGTTIQRLASYDRLENLDLSGSSIRDADTASINGFVQLETLRLRDCAIGNETLKRFQNCWKLRRLDLARTQIDDQGLAGLSRWRRLRTLDLTGTPVTDRGMNSLAAARSLRGLRLAGTLVTDQGLQRLQELKQLHDLDLSGTAVSDDGMPALGTLLQLCRLDLRNTKVTDAGIASLATLRQAEVIDLRGTQVTSQGLAKLRDALPWCRVLLTPADNVLDTEANVEFDEL